MARLQRRLRHNASKLATVFAPLVPLTLLALPVPLLAAIDTVVSAASADDISAVLAAIEEGSDVNERAPDGTTALHWAVYNDNVEMVQRLINAGADPKVSNNFGATAISEAATIANPAVLRLLLDAGADVESPGADGQTALMVVARNGSVDAAALLLDRGANVNAAETWRQQTALMWATAQRQPAMVALLVERGAEIDARSAINEWPRQVTGEPRRMYRPFGGLTPLMLAAREGCAECARLLVEGGANIDLADPKNVTPLFLAIDNFHYDVAKYLIERGANPNKWDWLGRTPLYSAVDLNTLPHGGRPDQPSVDETSGLEIIELLLAAGANPNAQLKLFPLWRHIGDDRGCDLMLNTGATALLRAAKTFDTTAMTVLIDHGAMLELPNDGGITPIMAAAGFGSVECDPRGHGASIPHYLSSDVEERAIATLTLLLDAGANINALTTAASSGARAPGRTALFGAAFWGWNEVVRFMVEHGAKIDVVDATGLTPVDAALGRAGGHGRGLTIEVFEDTADLLVALCAEQPPCDLTATPTAASAP